MLVRKVKGHVIAAKPAQSQAARGKLRRSLKLARAQAIELPKSNRESQGNVSNLCTDFGEAPTPRSDNPK